MLLIFFFLPIILISQNVLQSFAELFRTYEWLFGFLFCESQGHNLIYHTCTGVYTASGTMNAAEEALTSYGFSRGNKSYLINLAHVDGIQDKCAQVKGESLQLSRPRQNAFLQDLTKYWGEN